MPGFHLLRSELPLPTASAYGTGLTFDFSDVIPEGEKILAYTVVISGFEIKYATQSSDSYEEVQRFAIRLVPTLVGTVVTASVGLILTDYDGDATSETQDVSGRESGVTVVAIVYSDTSADNSWRLANSFAQPSGEWSTNLPIPGTTPLDSRVLIAGFDFLYSDNSSHGVNALNVKTGLQPGTEANTVQIQGSCTMDTEGQNSQDSTVDLAYLFQPQVQSPAVSTIQFIDVTPSWSGVGDGGMTASFNEQVTVPDGYQLEAAAFVLSTIDLEYGDYHDVGTIAAGLNDYLSYTAGATGTTTISGDLLMNLYADEAFGVKRKISSSSSLAGAIVAVFSPLTS